MKHMRLIQLIALLLTLAVVVALPPEKTSAAQGLNNAQIFALRYNADLNQRAAVAVAKQAAFVIAGGGDQTTLPKAREVMNNPEAEREHFIWFIVLDATVQGSPTSDAAIEAVVATHYDEIWEPAS
jgi:hypothetical protein